MSMTKNAKLTIIAILLITSAVIGYLLSPLNLTQSHSRNELQQLLVEKSGRLNRAMETMIDQETRFENARADEGKMIYTYKLIHQRKRRIDIDELRVQVEPQLQQQVCQSDSMQLYRDFKVTVEFRYLDSANESLFQLRFEPETLCK